MVVVLKLELVAESMVGVVVDRHLLWVFINNGGGLQLWCLGVAICGFGFWLWLIWVCWAIGVGDMWIF